MLDIMASLRVAENMNTSVAKWIGRLTMLISIVTWCLFLVWIMSDVRQGLGIRHNELTQSYFKLPPSFLSFIRPPCGCCSIDSWHPFLMSSAFFLFMTPAALSFEVCICSRSIHKRMHAILNSLSLLSAAVGLFIILDCHQNLHDEPIFNNSIHSIAGYLTLGTLALVYLAGLIFYGLGCGSDAVKKAVKPYHKRLGAVALLFGYGTILLGLMETLDKDKQLGIGQLIAGFIFVTLLGVVFSLFKFADKPHEELDTFHMYEMTDQEED